MRYGNPSLRAPQSGPGAGARAPDPRRLRSRMVREQIEARGVANPAIIAAMLAVPRHLFVPEAMTAHAYDDAALPIGYGQTISKPYAVARMTEALEVESGARVLEVGAGSGYQAAVLAAMGCVVFCIERLPLLYKTTAARLRQMGLRDIHVHRGDGTLGLPQAAPFERILVSAGGPEAPRPLIGQLAENGVMVIPVGERPRSQRLLRFRKSRGRVFSEDLGPAEFVDLVGDHGW